MTRFTRAAFVAVPLLCGCSIDSAKNHYVLAEKLWADQKYAAAVTEFEKVVAKDPSGKLGQQALYRAAMTQDLFLSQYAEAIRKFRNFADASKDASAVWDAQAEIGDILYSKTEQYDQAIQQYQAMLKQRPDTAEAPELLFRIGKSQFFLWRFDDALQTFDEIRRRFPASPWAEKSAYERAMTLFTQAERAPRAVGKKAASPYQEAKDAFGRFLRDYPRSTLVPLAQFGIASCLEEEDQLDEAYEAYDALKDSYPSPNVIQVKLSRIRERKAQRSR